MSAPAEQETTTITDASTPLRVAVGVLRGNTRPTAREKYDAADQIARIADALDALAAACGGCEAELLDGTLCGEYDETRIALCPACARKRDTAINHLTGATRP